MSGYAWRGKQAVNPCACGCGEEVSIAKRSDRRNGQVKGQPLRYVSGHNNTGRKLLDKRQLAMHARKAIAERCGPGTGDALLAVERQDDGSVILRLNSGGNVLAVESCLRLRGYQAEYAGSNPDGYGGAVRVTLKAGQEQEHGR